ncbi:hypothetical protein DL93DRAFT_134051 [Clavulina sp. PMI_390]|nr:hypothetical protein DL93DRAFT_134051 [Clavulina sp. PMI_390]
MPGANWTGGGRTTAKIQSKDRATRAHFGKQRIVQQSFNRASITPETRKISLSHAPDYPRSDSSTSPATKSREYAKVASKSHTAQSVDELDNMLAIPSKRKPDLLALLDEFDSTNYDTKRRRLLNAASLTALPPSSVPPRTFVARAFTPINHSNLERSLSPRSSLSSPTRETQHSPSDPHAHPPETPNLLSSPTDTPFPPSPDLTGSTSSLQRASTPTRNPSPRSLLPMSFHPQTTSWSSGETHVDSALLSSPFNSNETRTHVSTTLHTASSAPRQPSPFQHNPPKVDSDPKPFISSLSWANDSRRINDPPQLSHVAPHEMTLIHRLSHLSPSPNEELQAYAFPENAGVDARLMRPEETLAALSHQWSDGPELREQQPAVSIGWDPGDVLIEPVIRTDSACSELSMMDGFTDAQFDAMEREVQEMHALSASADGMGLTALDEYQDLRDALSTSSWSHLFGLGAENDSALPNSPPFLAASAMLSPPQPSQYSLPFNQSPTFDVLEFLDYSEGEGAEGSVAASDTSSPRDFVALSPYVKIYEIRPTESHASSHPAKDRCLEDSDRETNDIQKPGDHIADTRDGDILLNPSGQLWGPSLFGAGGDDGD